MFILRIWKDDNNLTHPLKYPLTVGKETVITKVMMFMTCHFKRK